MAQKFQKPTNVDFSEKNTRGSSMLKSGGRRTWIDRSMELKSALLHWEQLKVTLQTASTKHLNPRFTMLCPKSLAELLRMVEVDPLSTTKVGAVDRISRPRGGHRVTLQHKRGWLIRKSSEYRWNSSRRRKRPKKRGGKGRMRSWRDRFSRKETNFSRESARSLSERARPITTMRPKGGDGSTDLSSRPATS